MENKVFTVSILGCGSRGHYAYGRCMKEHFSDKFEIVTVCDIDPVKIQLAKAERYHRQINCFKSTASILSPHIDKKVALCYNRVALKISQKEL